MDILPPFTGEVAAEPAKGAMNPPRQRCWPSPPRLGRRISRVVFKLRSLHPLAEKCWQEHFRIGLLPCVREVSTKLFYTVCPRLRGKWRRSRRRGRNQQVAKPRQHSQPFENLPLDFCSFLADNKNGGVDL